MSDKPFIKNALENIPGGFLIYRADYSKEEIIFANQKLIDMFECEDYEDFLNFTHGSFKGVVCDDDYQAAENQIKIQINSGANNFDHIQYHIITKTGRVLYVEDFGQYVESEDEGPLFYVYIVDIETKSLSYDIDHVTGLPGDRRFIEYASRLVSVINRAGNFTDFAVVYINLVGFKHFNLKYGYKSGNAFLAEFAEILNEVFSTDLVARLSDDNFAVFADYKFVTEKLDKLNSIIGEKYVKEKVRIKAGIYVLGPNDEDHFDITIDKARTACQDISDKTDISYRLYDDEMRQKRELYEYVTAHIDEAIANGWIKVYYHPVVRTLTDKICSVEALARWIDPNYGFLAPYKFIGPLEDTRQIHKLDSYMILEVCRYIRERIDNGLELLPVSFNLSRHDFMLTDAFQVVLDACKKYEVPHRLIKIEITETTVIEDPILMKDVIDKFRNNGFEIYMDDFGSGYSSLNFLKNFDFDEIKLDMQFLSDFTEKSKTVIRNSIVMAKELGIQTLAEGVETQEQYDFLKSIGCEKAQGYLFSKPLPYEEVIALMKEKGFEHEENRFRNFFDEMAKINFVTEQPVCLVHDDGEIFNFKFYNDKLEELFKKLGVETIEALTNIINSPKSLFRRTIRKNMAYLPKVIGDEKVFFYTFLGNYIRFHLKNVGQVDDNNLYWIRLDNLSTNEENKQKNNLEASMREIYHIYDSVAVFDLRDDSYSGVVFDSSIEEDIVSNNLKFTEALKVLTKSIYYLDVNRFLEFSDVKTIKQRIIHSKEGY
ncbi:MAG: GGDEF domain-containing phosphodiesterase, partial [Acholeplasmatales bacterium]|nr:GGDEF domain-containing phosphodiesterase [Acholeplasmatales bacterium]